MQRALLLRDRIALQGLTVRMEGDCMRKSRVVVVLFVMVLVAIVSLVACSQGGQSSSGASSSASSEDFSRSDSAAVAADATAYGYAGDDPVEIAANIYMAEEIGKGFGASDASIPLVQIVAVDYTNPEEVLAYGDFWVFNYNINGNTLECVSGGDFPGVMHMTKDGDGYIVSSFDEVADGTDFASSAQELFGEHFPDFMKVYSDDESRNELRTITVTDYVNLNNLDVTQYQDFGWDPVQLLQ